MVHQGTGATNPNRDGAEEARGAHNPEVLGSNPSSGIFPIQKGGSAPLKPPLCRAGVEGFEGALDAPSSVALQKLLGGHTSTTQCLRPLHAEGFEALRSGRLTPPPVKPV